MARFAIGKMKDRELPVLVLLRPLNRLLMNCGENAAGDFSKLHLFESLG